MHLSGQTVPVDAVCLLGHFCATLSCFVLYRDEEMVPLLVNNLSDSPDENTQPNKHGTGWEQVWYYIKESHETSDIFRVELYWPMPFIKVSLYRSECSFQFNLQRNESHCHPARDEARFLPKPETVILQISDAEHWSWFSRDKIAKKNQMKVLYLGLSQVPLKVLILKHAYKLPIL